MYYWFFVDEIVEVGKGFSDNEKKLCANNLSY